MAVSDGLPHEVHDRGYKMLLSYLKIFQQLMEGYVEEDWKNRLDYENSKRMENSFIMKGFEKTESDVLYRVPILGEDKEIYLYVLIENQSRIDYTLAFRVLVYVVEIWKDHYKNTERKQRRSKKFRFPPVFPIVLYNGERSWTAATELKDLVEQGELFKEFIPNIKYHLVDIPRIEVDKLKEMGNALAGVFLLEHEIQSQEFDKALREALDLADKEKDEKLWKAFLEWTLMLLKREFPEKTQLLDNVDLTKQNRQEARTMLETMPKKLFALGEGQGIRKSIFRFLQARFGEISQEIKEKLNKIEESEKLEILLDKAALAQNLEEFATALNEQI